MTEATSTYNGRSLQEDKLPPPAPFPESRLGTPSWLHYWAVLTVYATLPLLLLGAEVTTKKVGMVDPQGFRAPWHMLTVALQERGLGFIIEHSHRLAGFIVGMCIIVLAAGLWYRESRIWLRWLGMAALAGVIIQGLLGGFRVQLNALVGPEMALIHGSFAQWVFVLLVSIALFTSRTWCEVDNPFRVADPQNNGIRRLALVMVGAIYLQTIFGALVRHTEILAGPRLHILGAFAVVILATVLTSKILARFSKAASLKRATHLLTILIFLQVVLGLETWLAKFASVEWPQLRPWKIHPELIRSIHYLIGALVFASGVATALEVYRTTSLPAPQPELRWEGAE